MPDHRYFDHETGQVIEELWDWETKTLRIRKTEDVEPLLDDMHEIRSTGRNGWSTGKNFRFMGSIPALEVERILREEGINLMENTPETMKRVKTYFRDNPKFSTKF
jgi:hypothetical protein